MKRDFDRLATERVNPRTARLDAMSVPDLLRAVNREDARVAAAVRRALPDIARAVRLLEGRLRRGGRLFFVGAGTSGRLGVLEAAELPPTFGVSRELAQAVMAGGPDCVFAAREGSEDDAGDGAFQLRRRGLRARDAVVGIAASGVTPFVHGALGEAKRRKAARVLVSCNRAGLPRGAADVVVAVDCGPEVIAGSTRLKAGTATKLVLNLLSVAVMVRLGKVYGNRMVDLRTTSDKLVARAERLVRELGGSASPAADLAAAGGSVKTAVVMLRLGVGRARAEALLAKAGGSLRQVIGG
jgi:N-acetylmuramic acid 6-phosphate etherase